ncbi:TetR/AcrR family transcriptional regulator [Streptomyces sp. NPDC085927]|uniref:TetR/AcrR family transcriptional regulator n=1 Tax=Streptomyces sp. NPDC085927 TaxID=3365738 RepID=UPI0037D8C4CF
MTDARAADRPDVPAPRRRDALRNRELLVRAARDAFAAEGLHTSLDRIARRAGVGSATLYRHFPHREALVDEVSSSTLTDITTAGDRALAVPSAWTGLTDYLYTVFAALPAERSVGRPAGPRPEGATTLELVHLQHRRTVGALLRQGQRQSTIGPDATSEDLLLAVASGPGPSRTRHGRAHRRPLALLLDGLRPHPAASRLPPTPSHHGRARQSTASRPPVAPRAEHCDGSAPEQKPPSGTPLPDGTTPS